VPFLTVNVAGLNAKFWILTAFDPCVGAGVVVGALVEVPPYKLQPLRTSVPNNSSGNAMIFFILLSLVINSGHLLYYTPKNTYCIMVRIIFMQKKEYIYIPDLSLKVWLSRYIIPLNC